MAKKISKVKEPVTIREKVLADGRKSLYLDCYVNGKRSYEFLKMYLIPERDANARRQNKDLLELANAIKSRRIIEIANGQAGITKKNEKLLLLDWIDATIKNWRDEFNGSVARVESVKALRHYIVDFVGNKKVYVSNVDAEWCRQFSMYLQAAKPRYHKQETISRNSASIYFAALSVVLKRAVIKGYLAANPCDAMELKDKPKAEKGERAYLTTAEFKKLISTPMINKEVCGAFAFCCLCGLRLSDVETLRWDEIDEQNGWITKRMKKTDDVVQIPLSETAKRFLPERRGDMVFELRARPYMGTIIKAWAKMAGINKEISWHTSRHSFATMTLENGGDLYAISKTLGHKSVTTTQIYAEMLDEQKRNNIALLDMAING